MIFVSVGTHEAPFDRLLRGLEDFPADVEMVVQHGHSSIRPSHADCMDFIPFETLRDLVQRADTVITHAGVGSIIVTLAEGKLPIVVPRLREYGEHVDNHQLSLATRLAEAGLVELVHDPAGLVGAVASRTANPVPPPQPGGRLAEELRGYLASQVHACRARARLSKAR
jgi:UDP-N-acetylglucosamine transferase subunit ALG13